MDRCYWPTEAQRLSMRLISHCPWSGRSMDLISIFSEHPAPSPGLCTSGIPPYAGQDTPSPCLHAGGSPSPGLCTGESSSLNPLLGGEGGWSQLRVLCFPRMPSPVTHCLALRKPSPASHGFPIALAHSLHHNPIPLVWCQTCLAPGLLITTVSLVSHSSGLSTENLKPPWVNLSGPT